MLALTVDALWAWAIMAGHKTLENRTWTTGHRGRIAIHAGRNSSRDNEPLRLMDRLGITPPDEELLQDLRGRILGTIEIADVIAYDAAKPIAANPWATGPWCWSLANGVWLQEPIPVSGQLGLWSWAPADPHALAEGPVECPLKPRSNLFSTSR